MKYDIYFHNDFDGRASAAVILNFLESRGDEIENFMPVDYGIKADWQELNPENPFIVVDFLYHPRAAFWFDHHPTTFLKKEWQENFKADKWRVLDTDSPSACGLVLKSLIKNFGYEPPGHIKELAKWLDIIDAAKYKSAKQTIEAKEAAIQLVYLEKDLKLATELIKMLSQEPMSKIVKEKNLKETLNTLKLKRKQALKFYNDNLKIYNGVLSFIDFSGDGVLELRFAPFYLSPNALYNLALKNSGHGGFHLTFSFNPWAKQKNKIHIGEFMQNNFGGGGHRNVGGAEFDSRISADKAVKKIIKIFP